jgi:hypothetical protein
VLRAGEGGQGDDLLAAVCHVPALGGDRGQQAQVREEHLRVAACRDRAECADELRLDARDIYYRADPAANAPIITYI